MKKWISALLVLVLLSQALPWTAFAATGDIITDEELTTAFLRAGLEVRQDGWDLTSKSVSGSEAIDTLQSAQRSEIAAKASVYRKGMEPDRSWDAQTILDYIDQMLSTDIHTLHDTLARALEVLERMSAENPATYKRLTEASDDDDVYPYVTALLEDVESVREDLRYMRDRMSDDVVTVEQITSLLKNSEGPLFDHEKVRYSEKIKDASADIAELRRVMIENDSFYDSLLEIANGAVYDGYEGDVAAYHRMDLWLSEVFDWDEGLIEKSVPAAAVKKSGTRLSRLSSDDRVLSKADSARASVRVASQNELTFQLKGEGNQGVQGVRVTLKDANAQGDKVYEQTTDAHGAVGFNANDFIADDEKLITLNVEIAAEAQGYQDVYIPALEIKRGAVDTLALTKLSTVEPKDGSAGSGAYIYSATFNGHDILYQDWTMLFSVLNDREFDIEITVKKPGGSSEISGISPELWYCKYKKPATSPNAPDGRNNKADPYNGDAWRWFLDYASPRPADYASAQPSSRKGNTFTFRGKWKQLLSPFVSKDFAPCFVLEKDGKKTQTKLISTYGKVDMPVLDGTEPNSPLSSLYKNGLGFKVTIPGIDLNLEVNPPFASEYWPKITVDPAGYYTVSIGSEYTQGKDPLHDWPSQEMKDYRQRIKQFEKDSAWAKQLHELGTAYKFYKERRFRFLAQSKLNFGMFVMLSGSFKNDRDDGSSLWSVGGIVGVTLMYSFDFTINVMLWVLPAYFNLNIGLSSGFGFGLQANLIRRDGKLVDYDIYFPTITLTLRFAVTATVGFGVKDLACVWIACTGAISLSYTFMAEHEANFRIDITSFVTVGAQFLFFKVTRKMWDLWNVNLYNSADPKSGTLMEQYMAKDAPQQPKQVSQWPDKYPQLAPEAKEVFVNKAGIQAGLKAAVSHGQGYAFYLGQESATGKGLRRLCWTNVSTGESGDIQGFIPSTYDLSMNIADRNDYAFDVKSDGDVIFVVCCCAYRFDEKGVPLPNDASDNTRNLAAYALCLEADDNGRLTNRMRAGDVNFFSCGEVAEASSVCKSFTNPTIDGTKLNRSGGKVIGYEVYGAFGQFEGNSGGLCFSYSGYGVSKTPALQISTDFAVKSPMGSNYERYFLRSSMRSRGSLWFAGSGLMQSNSFITLSRPRDGAAGDHAIELYDWDMNVARARTSIDTKTWKTTVTSTDRQSIVLDRGDIDAFELVQTLDADGQRYSQTIFYTRGETISAKDPETGKDVTQTRQRLRSLYIEPKEGGGTRNLTFNVTKFDYDVNLPTDSFRVATLGSTTYLYWVSTAPKKRDSDPDVWRVTGVTYDPATNTMSEPMVLSEFYLPGGSVPYDVLLTETGTGYLTSGPMTEEGDESSALPPLSLYSFPLSLKPVINLKGVTLSQTVVQPGDFIDVSFALMNEGNMGIASFDVDVLELASQDDEDGNLVETLHADCLDPRGSTLTMKDSGKVVKQGQAAFYRASDFELGGARRDWVTQREKTTYKVAAGKLTSSKKSDASTNYVRTDALMPGALASYMGSMQVPASWTGTKLLKLRIHSVSTYAKWAAAIHKAAGIVPKGANAAEDDAPLTYTLNERTGRLELETSGIFSKAAGDPVSLYPESIPAPEDVILSATHYDVDIDHRVYADYDGEDMLDIVILNHVPTDEPIHLSCAVYPDNEATPYYVSLYYDASLVASGKTQTITLPLSQVVDPEIYHKAIIEISALNAEESVIANNAFTVFVAGKGDPTLRVVDDPRDAAAREGGSASFTTVVAGGTQPYRYRWQVLVDGEWRDLADGGGVSGSATDTLTLENIPLDWNGRQTRCVITDTDGKEIITNTATLRVLRGGAADGSGAADGDSHPDTGDRSNLPLTLSAALAALALLYLLRRRYRNS